MSPRDTKPHAGQADAQDTQPLSVFAPGKLVLAGAYAVLTGRRALVAAVSRGAWAHGRASDTVYLEVMAAGVEYAHVDAAAMYRGEHKLGLGASAAALVATLGLREAESGADLSGPSERATLLARAREAHELAQAGGSGVDLAASVYGGLSSYRLDAAGRALVESLVWPPGAVLQVYFSGRGASTRAMREALGRWAVGARTAHEKNLGALGDAADEAYAAISSAGSVAGFVAAGQKTARALVDLGRAADVPIVPSEWLSLVTEAEREGAAFYPAGAGGGDVGVFVGERGPSAAFAARLVAQKFTLVDLELDTQGVRSGTRPEGNTHGSHV